MISQHLSFNISAVNIKHEGEESWNNMWQKIRSIWKYVHLNYRDDFDWFLLGGDDMYYIVENLKTYLESTEVVTAKKLQKGTEKEESTKPLYRTFFLLTFIQSTSHSFIHSVYLSYVVFSFHSPYHTNVCTQNIQVSSWVDDFSRQLKWSSIVVVRATS